MTPSSKSNGTATPDSRRDAAEEDLTRQRHAFREARMTLDYIVGQIEEGYDFKDDFGPHLLDEMRKISRFLEANYARLTLAADPGRE